MKLAVFSINNLGNYWFLFFVLQFQFAIKGSNAIPGNVQVKSKVEREVERKVEDVQVQSEVASNPVESDDVVVTNFEENCESHEIPLIAPSVIRATRLEIVTDGTEIAISEPNYSMRPKSISRNSVGNNSSDGSDWVEINSQYSGFSGSSRIARMIYSATSFVQDAELLPISFDALCSYLEVNEEKEMCEDELLLLCKRIIKEPETFVKALKDLPLFIQNYRYNQNAVKINSILYSYLGYSGECYKDLIEIENMENGSGSSRCSSRGSDSTIETPLNSPLSNSRTSTPSPKSTKLKTSSHIEETGHQFESSSMSRVLEEINEAQAHVPHIPKPPMLGHNYGQILTGYFPNTIFSLRHFNSIPIRPVLYPLHEETKSKDQSSSEDEFLNKIEEID